MTISMWFLLTIMCCGHGKTVRFLGFVVFGAMAVHAAYTMHVWTPFWVACVFALSWTVTGIQSLFAPTVKGKSRETW